MLTQRINIVTSDCIIIIVKIKHYT